MSRNLPPHELYSNKLSHLDLGYALFEPNPNGDYDMVRVGDVGYIEGGKFEKLFNAFHPADSHPANKGSDIPAGFEPIREPFRRTGYLETLMPGIRQSTGVRTVGGDLSFSGSIPGVLAGTNLRLSCNSGMGATLITKHCATRQRAKALRGMMKYMLDNRYSWLRLARDLGRLVELHDLVFVKECILTGDWANISWNDSSHDAEVGFNVNVPGAVGASLSFWGQWESHVRVPRRQGPSRSRPIRDVPISEELVLDQCIFLKGYRIALREWYNRVKFYVSARIMKPTRIMAKRDMLFSSRVNSSVLSFFETADCKLENVGDADPGSFRPVQCAYDILALYIFENSDADVAIMDDDDLLALNIASADHLKDICALFRRNRDLRTKIVPGEPGDRGLKVRRIDWELLDLRKASTDASYRTYLSIRDAPARDMVFLDEQFDRVQLGQKRSTVPTTLQKTDTKGKSRVSERDHEATQPKHPDWIGPSRPSYYLGVGNDTAPRSSPFSTLSSLATTPAGNLTITRPNGVQPMNASTRISRPAQPPGQQPLYNWRYPSGQYYIGIPLQENNLSSTAHELPDGPQRMPPWTREHFSGLRHNRNTTVSPTPTSTSTSTTMTTASSSTVFTAASSIYSARSGGADNDKNDSFHTQGFPTEEDARNAYRQNPSSNENNARDYR